MLNSECLVLPWEEYERLRNQIIQELLTIYERVDYSDADWRHYHIIIVGSIGYHRCTHCFHAGDWVTYLRSGTLKTEMEKALTWGRKQIERIGELKTVLPRMKVKEPVTANTVLRSADIKAQL